MFVGNIQYNNYFVQRCHNYVNDVSLQEIKLKMKTYCFIMQKYTVHVESSVLHYICAFQQGVKVQQQNCTFYVIIILFYINNLK